MWEWGWSNDVKYVKATIPTTTLASLCVTPYNPNCPPCPTPPLKTANNYKGHSHLTFWFHSAHIKHHTLSNLHFKSFWKSPNMIMKLFVKSHFSFTALSVWIHYLPVCNPFSFSILMPPSQVCVCHFAKPVWVVWIQKNTWSTKWNPGALNKPGLGNLQVGPTLSYSTANTEPMSEETKNVARSLFLSLISAIVWNDL